MKFNVVILRMMFYLFAKIPCQCCSLFVLQSLALASHAYEDQMSDSEVADLFARVRHSVVSDNYSIYFYSLFIHSAFII